MDMRRSRVVQKCGLRRKDGGGCGGEVGVATNMGGCWH